MNYCEFHLGDYAKAAAHLSLVEHGVYFGLLRRYYSSEKPLPTEVRDVQRLVGARTDEEQAAVVVVLQEFFVLCDDGHHQTRCDSEIARYREKQDKARRSANARWGATKSQFGGSAIEGDPHTDGNANAVPNAMRSHNDGNALQSPDTSHQSPTSVLRTAVADRDEAPADSRTGAEAAATHVLEQVAVMDRKDGDPLRDEDQTLLWKAGRHILAEAGIKPDAAGRFLGKLVKDCGNDRVLVFDAMRAACLERPVDPRGWITATCQRMRGERVPPNKQEALEKRLQADGDAWAARIAADAAANDPSMQTPDSNTIEATTP